MMKELFIDKEERRKFLAEKISDVTKANLTSGDSVTRTYDRTEDVATQIQV
jgi:hypothetical protein